MAEEHRQGDTGARDRLRRIYDPELVRQTSVVLGECLAAYFGEALAGQASAMAWHHPPELVDRAAAWLDDPPGAAEPLEPRQVAEHFRRLAETFLAANNRLHSPHYMGHQVPASVPLAGLFDALGSVTNQCMAIYEMGPFATAIEKAVTARLGTYLGWRPGQFAAIGTHGGSLANLTALLTARNVRYPRAWEEGIGESAGSGGRGRPAVIASAESHYCITRAAGIVGLGTDQVLKAPLDDRRRIRPQAVIDLLDEAPLRGLDVFCLVGSACATPVGAFDPLDELADIAADRGLWLHVDGAHGASALLSRRHRRLVRGIERADSITWDAHKMLFVPALATFLFYRSAQHSEQTFRQDAPFLFDPAAPYLGEYDGGVRTIECTKRALTLGLWGLWATFGPGLFEDLVDVTFALGQEFYQLLRATDDFVPLHEPQCNILCFRYLPARLRDAPLEQISGFQQSLRRRIVESGEFYITSTRIDGAMALRVTLINPLTDRQHLEALLAALRHHGTALLREGT